jgi:hypothetical protein
MKASGKEIKLLEANLTKPIGIDVNQLALAFINEKWEIAAIEDKRQTDTLNEEEYYVHPLNYNRRMDQWVAKAKININTVEIQKQIDEIKASIAETDIDFNKIYEHDEHKGMDEKDIIAHMKATKYKNINKIQIGKYIIDTWYSHH